MSERVRRSRVPLTIACGLGALAVAVGLGLAASGPESVDRVVTVGAEPATATATVGSGPTVADYFSTLEPYPGIAWTRGGEPVARDEVTTFSGPEHCDWQRIAFLGWSTSGAPTSPNFWLRDPAGDYTAETQAGFRARAELPADAAFTGYASGPVELWSASSDGFAYVYLVNARDPADAERWVGTQGGCA